MYLRWCLSQALNVRRFLSDKLKGVEKLRAHRISKLLTRETALTVMPYIMHHLHDLMRATTLHYKQHKSFFLSMWKVLKFLNHFLQGYTSITKITILDFLCAIKVSFMHQIPLLNNISYSELLSCIIDCSSFSHFSSLFLFLELIKITWCHCGIFPDLHTEIS